MHANLPIVKFGALFILLTTCSVPPAQPTVTPIPTEPPQANMPNPASTYCEEQGNRLEIRTAADGSQTGVCIFPDGSECDEWAYYRKECGPTIQNGTNSSPTAISTAMPIDPADYQQGWWKYKHSTYGFSIMLPDIAGRTMKSSAPSPIVGTASTCGNRTAVMRRPVPFLIRMATSLMTSSRGCRTSS